MDPVSAILIGVQAAGMIVDIFGKEQAYQSAKEASRIETQQLNTRMQQEQLVFQEQSVADLRSLESTLASQRALMAARGVLPGVGSALSVEQKSIQAFKKDTQARELSNDFLKQQREMQKRMAAVEMRGLKSKKTMGQVKSIFDNINTNEMAGLLTGKLT